MNIKSGRLTYYTQPPKSDQKLETKVLEKLSPLFDIDALLAEEKELFNSIDDTKVIVNGVEFKSNEPTKVNFDEMEKEEAEDSDDYEDIDDDEDEDDDSDDDDENDVELVEEEEEAPVVSKKVVKFVNDAKSLNRKVSNKIKADSEVIESHKQTADRSLLKRKAIDGENQNEIYQSENIPRTKKMQKMEMKKKIKKAKRSGKRDEKL
jgi:hypothetical protein